MNSRRYTMMVTLALALAVGCNSESIESNTTEAIASPVADMTIELSDDGTALDLTLANTGDTNLHIVIYVSDNRDYSLDLRDASGADLNTLEKEARRIPGTDDFYPLIHYSRSARRRFARPGESLTATFPLAELYAFEPGQEYSIQVRRMVYYQTDEADESTGTHSVIHSNTLQFAAISATAAIELGETPWVTSDDGALSLRLSTPATVLASDDPMVITAELRNNTDEALYTEHLLAGTRTSAGLTLPDGLKITDPNGKELTMWDTLIIPPEHGGVNIHHEYSPWGPVRELDAGETWTRTLNLTPDKYAGLDTTGVYTLSYVYRSREGQLIDPPPDILDLPQTQTKRGGRLWQIEMPEITIERK